MWVLLMVFGGGAPKSMQITLKLLQIKIPVCLYDCTIHFANIHPLIIIFYLREKLENTII
jgi:hypothetical protein